ncbi:hypothetical protein V5O48_015508 [Marasmius crinis-equi]|uniref:Enoyl reductase (ER) domain-containing protein n=1 Tax=Marasmius crinis-equi TaxID=585013 RepID=A0ABR3EUB8_9AGAR
MSSQKALFLLEEKGSFAVDTRNIPSLDQGEVLVKIQAAALNPVDWKIQKYGGLFKRYPAITGTDIAGDVVEVSKGVENLQVGDRVVFQGWFANDYSGFQQFTKVSAEIVAKIPKSLSYSQAASVPLGLATAAIGLFWTSTGAGLNPTVDQNVQFPGQYAVVIGGSSSVGQYAIQLLKFSGFSPIVTYASSRHADFLKSLGATHVIDRQTIAINDLPTEVKKITEKPVRAVYDAISLPETQEAGYATLAEDGDLILVLEPKIKNPVENKKIHYVFGNVQPEANRPFGRALYKNLGQFLEDGTIVPNRPEELPNGLAGIVDGLERLQNDKVSGTKLIALPQETP